MLERLKKLLKEQIAADVEGIDGSSNLKTDLGLSSLDLAELAILIEDEFDIEIPDRAIKDFKTVGDVMDFIAKQ